MRRFSNEELWSIRNEVPIRALIKNLSIPTKDTEVRVVVLCPICKEFQGSVHPKENLLRCFGCQRNFNPLELFMAARQISFHTAAKALIEALQRWKVKRSYATRCS